ncbi:MAG: alcohol dehydrogenase [Betaproteobacteria bacterium]|nr:MAG: alcohol dehydrogenase [Betaproteobacteria bacterium]
MRVAQLAHFGRPEEVIDLVEQPDPGEPALGEVIVDAEFVPINPADVLNLEGKYGAEPPKLPLVPGAEGVGRVISCGAGVSHVKPGDRVLLPGPGTWRERFKAPAKAVFALPEGVDPQQLAMLRVNPPTAHLMLHDFVPVKPGHWVIQNAANSGVGHCLIRLAREAGVKSVNIVRRTELLAPLRAHGGDVVLTDGPDLDARVRAAVGDGALPLAIDAVGGSATQRLARCLQEGGTVVNYGLLSGEPCLIDARETVFRDISLRGFWLRRWFMVTPPGEIAALYRRLAAKIADGTLKVDVEAVYPIEKIRQAVAHAARAGRAGKILMSFRKG